MGDCRRAADLSGQAKVRELGFLSFIDEDIRRFHVAVHDAGPVGIIEGLGDLPNQLGRLVRIEGLPFPPLQPRREGFAADQLHVDVTVISSSSVS